jgi:spore coat protein U domain-containing protein, fimbrial subunit CupE1/2/3/6
MLKIKSSKSSFVTLSSSLAAVGALLLAGTASAATSTANLGVSASVVANCSITSAPIAFGAYNTVTGVQVDNQGSVTVSCTLDADSVITLGQGANDANGSAAAPQRRLVSATNAAEFLDYQLFQETGRTTVWGNTAGTGVAYTGIGSTEVVDVFGRIAAGQNVAEGTFTDTVVATITF